MEEYITFISDNYIVFLIILLVIIFSVIGYLSDKKGFLKKKDKINNFNSEKNDSVKSKDEEVSTLKSNLDNPTNETQEQLIEPELTSNQEENIDSQKDDNTNTTVDNDNLKTNDLNNDNDIEKNNLNDILEQIKNLKIPNIDGMDQDIENKEKTDEEDIWKF